jgi:hypothetical protein
MESAPAIIPSTEVSTAGPVMVKGELVSSEDLAPVHLDEDNDTMVNPIPTSVVLKTPKSPNLHPIIALDMPSPFAITPQSPISPSTPVASSTEKSLKNINTMEQSSSALCSRIRHQVEGQIQRLAKEIDTFKTQRDVLSNSIRREQEVCVQTV